MTRRVGSWVCLATLVATLLGATVPVRAEPTRLLVLIVVDQFRADLLERYRTYLSGGLARLLEDGRWFRQTLVDHAITNSAPGHATIATGLVPARHGVVGNEWLQREPEGAWELVSSEFDSDERILGAPDLPGVSPRRRLADGLADWVLAADQEARAVAVGQGPTSSMALAARSGGQAYFFSPAAGRYVTSSYFRERYPDWVDRFNRETLPALMEISGWDLTAPDEAVRLARRDAASYEADGVHTSFPHRFRDEVEPASADDPVAFAEWFSGTPALDEATLALASAAVDALDLGRRGVVDYLGVNLSSLDDVGHRYGPLSVEQLDTVLRLDRALGSFFERLDGSVGAGGYVVALTADHGVANVPEYEQELHRPGRRVDRKTLADLVDAAVAAAGDRRGSTANWQRRVAALLERRDFVADAMTASELETGDTDDPFVELYRNSYRPDRRVLFPVRPTADGASLASLGLFVRFTEGTIPDYAPAVHGSPYLYDRHVPLLFMGPGVEPGVSDEPAKTVDVAPTLAVLARVSRPEGLDGRPLATGQGSTAVVR